MLVREGEAPAAAESSGANEIYRFDYSEQTQKYQVDQGRQLQKHLSGISWNGGATRQALDIAAFGILEKNRRGTAPKKGWCRHSLPPSNSARKRVPNGNYQCLTSLLESYRKIGAEPRSSSQGDGHRGPAAL